MRKLVYGALALSAAMAVSFGVNVSQADAASTTWKVAQCEGDVLTINDTVDEPIFVGVPTIKTKKGESFSTATVANWDYYNRDEDGNVTVDLSKYPIKKENYLLVKAGTDLDKEATLIVIPASSALTGVKYETTKKITVKDASKAAYSANDLEYYTENQPKGEALVKETDGTFNIPEADLFKYENTGAAVFVRAKEKKPDDYKVTKENGEIVAAKVNGNTLHIADNERIPYITVNTRQGKAAKITVKKLANAPKITVDYVNGSITIPGTTKAPASYAFAGVMGNIGNDYKPFTFKATTGDAGVTQTATNKTAKTVVKLSDNIEYAYGPWYVDVWSTGTKKARTVFAGQVPTSLTTGTGDEAVKNVTAQVVYGSKGYSVKLTNNDANNAYIVTVKDKTGTDTKAPYVKTVNAFKGTKPGTLSIATKITDPSNVSISIQTQGNKTNMQFPGISEPLTSEYVDIINDGNKEATFNVLFGDTNEAGESALKGKLLVGPGTKLEDAITNTYTYKGNGSFMIKAATGQTVDFSKIKVEYYNATATTAAKQWVEITKKSKTGKISELQDTEGNVAGLLVTAAPYDIRISITE